MTKTMIKLIAPALAVVALSGCARNIESGTYAAGHVGEASFTYQGVIVSARKVNVEGHESLEDNTLGMAMGAVGGGLAPLLPCVLAAADRVEIFGEALPGVP